MKHYIIVKYNDSVPDKSALTPGISALFEPCKNIAGIHGVRIFQCVTDFPNRYDIMIVLDMEKDALSAFNASEIHHNWKRDYTKYMESKAIFDGD